MKKFVVFFSLCFLIVLGILFAPHIFHIVKYKENIKSDLDSIVVQDVGILFGAKVYDDGSLSPVAKERADAAVLLFENKKISEIFVSGTNHANKEVEVTSQYLIERGIPEGIIVQDFYGIDTNDTCLHASTFGYESATFITQGFHLPRSLYMCKKNNLQGQGVAVEDLELLEDRGGSVFVVMQTRVGRFFRESLLTWLYMIGVYDAFFDMVPYEVRIGVETDQPSSFSENVIETLSSNSGTSSIEKISLFNFSQEDNFRFIHSDNPKSILAWSDEFPNAKAVFNGVYFHEDNLPSGYLVIDGERIGSRQFDLDLTGLISFDFGFDIIDTSLNAMSLSLYDNAAQSFPFLIKNGEHAISEDSGLKARRTFVGTTKFGEMYVGVVPYEEVSLYVLAEELTAMNIDWDMVLNLDGGPSTGIIVRQDGKEVVYGSLKPVPNVIVIE